MSAATRAGVALVTGVMSAVAAVAVYAAVRRPAGPPLPRGTELTRMVSRDGQAEILLRPPGPLRGLVLFMHGLDGDQDQVNTDAGLAGARDALLRGGFAIAASNSHGNNAGNPASVQDQLALLSDAERRLPPVASVDILAFSMGGLDALVTASDHRVPRLQALALISPACNQVAFLQSRFAGTVRAAFQGPGGGRLVSRIAGDDPMMRPPTSFRGYRYHFWQSPTDDVVPAAQVQMMRARLRSAGIGAPSTPLVGGHGDLSRLEPQAVLGFFLGKEN